LFCEKMIVSLLILIAAAAVSRAQPPFASSSFTDRGAVAQDFGYVVSDLPRYTFCPTTTQQMSEIVSYAKQNDLKLVVRGRGHSTLAKLNLNQL